MPRFMKSKQRPMPSTTSILRKSGHAITKEFEASYQQTVEHTQKPVAATKKQCDDQVAIEQARFI